MPATPLVFSSGMTLATATADATEVVVATCNGVTMRYPGQRVSLIGHVLLTTAGSTTSVVVRIRKASLTGTLINDQTAQAVTAAAATTNMYLACGVDTPAEIDQATYVLTVVCTAGSGAGSAVYAILDARVD